MTSCSPQSTLTPSCLRVFHRFESYLGIAETAEPGYLVLAVLAEESLASSCLQSFGVNLAAAEAGCLGKAVSREFATLLGEGPLLDVTANPIDCRSIRLSLMQLGVTWAVTILDRAQIVARHQGDADVSTQHLMLGMMEAETPVQSLLIELGVDKNNVVQRFSNQDPPPTSLQVDFEFDLLGDRSPATLSPQPNSDSRRRIVAVLDANLNRCREGLRVLDDLARFVLQSTQLTSSLKQLRHRLVSAEKTLLATVPDLLACRDTAGDAGTAFTTTTEMQRENVDELAAANARRVQESLRSLEEFGKLFSPKFAAEVKQIRYESYVLHQQLAGNDQQPSEPALEFIEQPALGTERQQRLAAAKLYVLVTESLCQRPWQEVVQEALAGGADVIQLREKELPTSEVILRGRWVSAACKASGALFIMNDLPEVAVSADADGVHVGQEDISPSEARRIVGASRLVGLSTHSSQQITSATSWVDVDYLGVGPVFPSGTKSFQDFPGLALIGEAATIATKPWFAIGGIKQTNLAEVCSVGGFRVAVCGAIIADPHPWEATAAIRAMLDEDGAADVLKFNRG